MTTGLDAKTTPTQELIRHMTGRSIEYVFPPKPEVADREPLLRVEGLGRTGEFSGVSFDVRPG